MTTRIKTAIGADDGAILECSGVERRFGGIVAVTGVDLVKQTVRRLPELDYYL